jgi:DNA-binding Lrp family transcriptional regulator
MWALTPEALTPEALLNLLKQDGQIVAKALSEQLGLSEDTIRRDLRELAKEGLLQRVHGGALPLPPPSPAMGDFAARQQLSAEAKPAIARAAMAMIRPGEVVFIDGGTTAVQLARQLPHDLRCTVVTRGRHGDHAARQPERAADALQGLRLAAPGDVEAARAVDSESDAAAGGAAGPQRAVAQPAAAARPAYGQIVCSSAARW